MHKVGRPLIYKTPEELKNKINEYLEQTDDEKITITGLCLALNINKDTFYEYGKKEGYKEIIDIAKLVVENSYELSLRKYGRTGDIFALKNFGWTDKQEIESENKNINMTYEEYLSKIEDSDGY